MFGRSKLERTHTQLLTDELAESYGHLKRAAGHAAGGAAEKLTPPYDRARFVAARGWSSTRGAFTPLYRQVRQGATNARRESVVSKKRTNRWSSLFGLLAAGVAVGAAGALVTRRRRAAQQWETYEPATEEPYQTEPAAGGVGATSGATPGGAEAAGAMDTTGATGRTGGMGTEGLPSTGGKPGTGAAGPGSAGTPAAASSMADPTAVADAVAEAVNSPTTKPGGTARERSTDRPRSSRPAAAPGGSPLSDSSGDRDRATD